MDDSVLKRDGIYDRKSDVVDDPTRTETPCSLLSDSPKGNSSLTSIKAPDSPTPIVVIETPRTGSQTDSIEKSRTDSPTTVIETSGADCQYAIRDVQEADHQIAAIEAPESDNQTAAIENLGADSKNCSIETPGAYSETVAIETSGSDSQTAVIETHGADSKTSATETQGENSQNVSIVMPGADNLSVAMETSVADSQTSCSDTPGAGVPTDDKDQPSGSSKSAKSRFKLAAIDNEEVLNESLKTIEQAVKDDPIIALDCEGDNLSRKGKIQLVSIATRKRAFLFDIKKLKAIPFELGLRTILEKQDIKKLMFDCREDADALFHQFKVNLDGVVDIQLLEIIKRTTIPQIRNVKRRSNRLDEVVQLKGLLRCVEEYIQSKKIIKVKQSGKGKMCDWGIRPLEKGLLKYAAVDAYCLFLLFDKLLPDDEEMMRLEVASKIYVDLKRSMTNRSYDKYENNGYLPIDVIPDKGRLSFDIGSTSCTKCTRKFPTEEFSWTQLRNGNQLCRKCKKVKQDIDTDENRTRQFEREYDCDYYYSSEDDYVY